jgi:hypothetical protein
MNLVTMWEVKIIYVNFPHDEFSTKGEPMEINRKNTKNNYV